MGVIIGLGMLGTGGAFFIYYYIIQKLGPVLLGLHILPQLWLLSLAL
jgi:drug/metabolite transporter (DMT)-like permease